MNFSGNPSSTSNPIRILRMKRAFETRERENQTDGVSTQRPTVYNVVRGIGRAWKLTFVLLYVTNVAAVMLRPTSSTTTVLAYDVDSQVLATCVLFLTALTLLFMKDTESTTIRAFTSRNGSTTGAASAPTSPLSGSLRSSRNSEENLIILSDDESDASRENWSTGL